MTYIPNTRQEALQLGSVHYYGFCKKHGNIIRFTRSCSCMKCANDRRQRYRDNNRDKVREAERSLYNKPITLDRWLKRCVKTAKGRAKTIGLPFDIDFDYLKSIWTGICPIFGIELIYTQQGRLNAKNQPSLDRIKPHFGYIRGNVEFISYFANAIKQDATADELLKVAHWLHNKCSST